MSISDEQREKRLATLRAAATRGLPALAIGRPEQMGDALLMLVRDPRARYPRLVVLNDQHMNDALMAAAYALTLRDEREVPEAREERRISLHRGNKLKLVTGGVTKWAAFRTSITNATGMEYSEAARKAAKGHETIEVQGLGRVQLISSAKRR